MDEEIYGVTNKKTKTKTCTHSKTKTDTNTLKILDKKNLIVYLKLLNYRGLIHISF